MRSIIVVTFRIFNPPKQGSNSCPKGCNRNTAETRVYFQGVITQLPCLFTPLTSQGDITKRSSSAHSIIFLFIIYQVFKNSTNNQSNLIQKENKTVILQLLKFQRFNLYVMYL